MKYIQCVAQGGGGGGYAVSRGPLIFLDKKAERRVPPLLDLSRMIEGPLHTEYLVVYMGFTRLV